MQGLRGLTDIEAAAALQKWGRNALPTSPPDPLWRQFGAQLGDPLILTLLAAAAIATGVGATSASSGWLVRYGDAVAILTIVVMNAILGVFQERRASQALAALSRMAAPHARVRREGRDRLIDVAEVVPGDLLLLEAGDAIAADGVLREAHGLATQESMLTGESASVAKRSASAEITATDDASLVHGGTQVVAGSGIAEITATGPQSQLGKLGELMRSVEVSRTPLQLQLDRFSQIILRVCLGLAAALFVWGCVQGGQSWTQLLLESISLAVAAIPEGLPAITTIALALGMARMARRGALVRRLSAVETLGAATVICTDKTGTLTRNEMQVVEDVPAAGGERALLEACVRSVVRETDPMDAALVHFARARGVDVEALRAASQRTDEVPFDSVLRCTSVTYADGATFVKGAVETLLPRCHDVDAETVRQAAERMATDGLRVLGLARGEPLVFVGLVGLLDPPRAEAADAIRACKRAGVIPIMVTGDHPATALAVARSLDLYPPEAECVTGDELERMSHDQLAARIDRIRVFARTTPAQKLRIVDALKTHGHVVAMTGDGVNDAPALRAAHIGVAMGRAGTDVAREAADLVLADDNFATIVTAVEEGRAIYRNIQKFIFFLLSSNLGLVLAVFAISTVSGWPPLTPLMILWINLVTNGLPALALGVDRADPTVMSEPPRATTQPLLIARDYVGMLVVGIAMGAAALWVYLDAPQTAEGLQTARSMAFCILALSPLVHAFSCRSPHLSALAPPPPAATLWLAVAISLSIHLLAVLPAGLRSVFHTVPLSGSQWLRVALLSLLVLPVVEAAKAVYAVRRAPSVRAGGDGSR